MESSKATRVPAPDRSRIWGFIDFYSGNSIHETQIAGMPLGMADLQNQAFLREGRDALPNRCGCMAKYGLQVSQ
jgi:hypothetical protein